LAPLGGFKGRKIEAGDELPIGASAVPVKEGRSTREGVARTAGGDADGTARHAGTILASPHEAAGTGFFSDTWKVAPEADRIGYRFKGGKPLAFVPREPPFGAGSDPSNITRRLLSLRFDPGARRHRADCVAPAMQCPAAAISWFGTVIAADMDLIGQLQPNTPVKFVKVGMDQALARATTAPDCWRELRSALA